MQKLRSKISSKKNIQGAQLVNLQSEKTSVNSQKIEKIIEKYIKTPHKLFEYIKKANTKIYRLKNPDKILCLIGEKQGFIYPKKGFKALYLNLILNKKISLKTSEMFVIDKHIDMVSFLYQFYHWYNYKTGIKGYNNNYSDKMKYIFEFSKPKKLNDLSYDDIIELKLAIKRDIEAIDFVKKMTLKYEASKKCLNKIAQGQGANI